jgi:hypothetical protein
MINKTNRTARDRMIIDAIAAHFNGTASITVGGKLYKAKDLQAQFQAEMDAAKETQSAKTAYLQATLAERTVTKQVTPLYKALRSYLIGLYGASSAIVADFGFTPKNGTVDVATKAAAIEKRAATRKARGTMGKRQKLEVTGTVPATTNGAASAPVVADGATPKAATPSS